MASSESSLGLIAKLYPGIARRLGFVECAGEADLNTNTAQPQGYCDEASRHVCSSYSPMRMLMGPRIRSHLRPARSDTHQILRPTRMRPRKNKRTGPSPYVSDKGSPRRTSLLPRRHLPGVVQRPTRVCETRKRHFTQIWRCPGPCRTHTVKGGWFARNETLKRHLLFPKFAECKDAAMKVLNLGTLPTSSTEWMAPFRDGPERPWECARFQLTDLQTVKEWLRDPNSAPPLAEPIRGRHRPKKPTSSPLNFTTYIQ